MVFVSILNIRSAHTFKPYTQPLRQGFITSPPLVDWMPCLELNKG